MGLFGFLRKKPQMEAPAEVPIKAPALTSAEKAALHLREGNLGSYAIDLLEQAKEFCKADDYQNALRACILRFCVDVAGIYDLEYFDSCKADENYIKGQYKPIPVIVPHTIRTISKAVAKLEMDDASFQEYFYSLVTDDQIPCRFCTAKECYALLILALENQEAAYQGAKKYARRFVRREGL